MSNWWPTPFVYIDSRVAPEFVYLWCLLLAVTLCKRTLSPSMLTIVCGGYALLVLGRYFDTTAPALFGRPINLYWDGLQIPRLLMTLSGKYPGWLAIALALGLLAALLALFFTIQWCIRICVTIALPHAANSRVALAITAFFLLSSIANAFGVEKTWPYISRAVLPTYWLQAKILASAVMEGTGKTLVPESPKFSSNLAQLKGSDFKLFFFESYGAVTYDNPQMRAALEPSRDALLAQLKKSNLNVVSAFVTSTTFGGGTDLAHMALMTGIDTRDPLRHDVLLTTDRPTLIKHFRTHGFEAFGFYPGLDWDWPEGSFFGFSQIVDARALRYQGPAIGYWKIPDQLALAHIRQQFPITAQSPPRMMFFASSTSHSPFHPVPPYQQDWKLALDKNPFPAQELERVTSSSANWLNMTPAYTEMIQYNFRWLTGYLEQPHERDFVMLVLGDHQPTSNITGEGASWDVPVHLISSKAGLLQRFESLGFTKGLMPQRAAIATLPALTTILLKGFSDEAGEPQ
jgi:hypothetical protein